MGVSGDQRRLYSGGRKDGEIHCWDLRNPSRLLHSLHREVYTNQRIQFDFAGDHVLSGGTDGSVRIWNSQGKYPVSSDFEKYVSIIKLKYQGRSLT